MQHALVNGQRTEALPSLRGICQFCGTETIAKCGQHMVWHWAHKSLTNCDRWWESETDWHRQWKNLFPKDWQEIIRHDTTGERHIADILSLHETVVEFQHSPIDPLELKARESFYDNMIWVVDGTRSEIDPAFFRMGLHTKPTQPSPPAHQLDWSGRSRLLQNWSQASKPVFLDFGRTHGDMDRVWRLIMFDAVTKVGFVGPITNRNLIENIMKGVGFPRITT